MTDTAPDHQPEPNKDRRVAALVYILYLVGLITGNVAGVIGVIIAHVKDGSVNPVCQSHLTYQIRTFWFGLATIIVGVVLSVILVGYLVLMWWFLWVLIRSLKGLLAVNDDRPIDDPKTLLW
jgi:uncharacterized membrane protein